MSRKVWMGLGVALVVVLGLGGLAAANFKSLILFAVGNLARDEIGPTQTIEWAQGPATAPPGDRPPNVVIILADDLGINDISTFGGCTAGPAAAIENMDIIIRENLLENTTAMGARLVDNLNALSEKHKVIGQVRGKGLFCGAELVADRVTKDPADEKKVLAVVADCMQQGVIIGATNRSLPGLNNTLCFSPALIATADDIDHITDSVDGALGRVFG